MNRENDIQSSQPIEYDCERSKTGRPNVAQKVQFGRRTMNSLMGVGAYGNSSLNPMVSVHLRRIYALPRVLYGLKVQTCLQLDIQIKVQTQMTGTSVVFSLLEGKMSRIWYQNDQ